jgi:hypothetical protein
VYAFDKLINETRRLAVEYRKATGKPLAVTGELARHDAARLLDLELVEEPGSGYDAVGRGEREGLRIQVKGRAIFDDERSNQRIGQLRRDRDWDLLMLVLMDEAFEPVEIYEAEREVIDENLAETTDSRRAKRGAMSIARLKIIGRLVWSRERGLEDDGYWDNQANG